MAQLTAAKYRSITLSLSCILAVISMLTEAAKTASTKAPPSHFHVIQHPHRIILTVMKTTVTSMTVTSMTVPFWVCSLIAAIWLCWWVAPLSISRRTNAWFPTVCLHGLFRSLCCFMTAIPQPLCTTARCARFGDSKKTRSAGRLPVSLVIAACAC